MLSRGIRYRIVVKPWGHEEIVGYMTAPLHSAADRAFLSATLKIRQISHHFKNPRMFILCFFSYSLSVEHVCIVLSFLTNCIILYCIVYIFWFPAVV